ncbi:class I SAM-dependent RNA methyltransferase, partial [Corynebacterium sp. 11254D000AR]
PHRGWRTRVRLGVDSRGRAGTRKRASNDLVTDVACTQLAPGLVDGIVGPGARTFTPGAEVIAVLDSTGARHVIETRKGPRGKRVEKIEQVVEGTAGVVEEVDGHRFEFPATAFWQAHRGAPEAYTGLVAELLGTGHGPAWDLYGGVGLFVPTLSAATGGAETYSVDLSPAARPDQQPGLAEYAVRVKSARVDKVIGQLPPADAVVLDPPRVGAGAEVVARIAEATPNRVVHIGCDPAALSRDLSAWVEAGYGIDRMVVVNAFPGTHHFETLVLLTPRPGHDVR